jgi:hypothetical protein
MATAGVLARVEKEALNLVNAAVILGLSYRQTRFPPPYRTDQMYGGGLSSVQ